MKYQIIAKGRHGTHSPFVYKLVEDVFSKLHAEAYAVPEFESIHKSLLLNKKRLHLFDFKSSSTNSVEIRQFAQRSTSRLKFRKLLTALSDHLEVSHALEAGTAFGISAAYLSKSKQMQVVHTLDGNAEVFEIAKSSFGHLENISFHQGNVFERFGELVREIKPQLVFLDADHRGTTIDYYLKCLEPVMKYIKVIIVHDIYWSPDMYQVWKKHRSDFPISIDIFQAGLLFPNVQTPKQQFCLKF